MNVLDRLLRPISRSRFFEEYFEKNFLFLDNNGSNHFGDLLSRRDLESLLFDVASRRDTLNVVGASTDSVVEKSAPSPDSKHPSFEWLSGRTLIFNGLERRHDGLAALSRSIEADLGATVQCNVYLTPPSAQGFKAHYDTHDVFVLQLFGEKTWRVGGNLFPLPFSTQASEGEIQIDPKSCTTLVLKPGDLLYIPRGWSHDAVTSDKLSCHVTIGLHVPTFYDILIGAITNLAHRDERLRRSALLGRFGTETVDALSSEASDLLGRIGAQDFKESQRLIYETLISRQRQPVNNSIVLAERLGALSPNDRIRAINGLMFRIEGDDSDQIRLLVYDRVIQFPAWVEGAVRRCLNGSDIRIGGIATDLDEESALVLAVRLLKEGVVELLD